MDLCATSPRRVFGWLGDVEFKPFRRLILCNRAIVVRHQLMNFEMNK